MENIETNINQNNVKSKDDSAFFAVAKTLGVIVLIVCFFVFGFIAGKVLPTSTFGSDMGLRSDADTKADMDMFWTVWNAMNDYYVDEEKVDPQKMVEGAIKGMVDSFEDPATLYFTKEETDTYNDQNSGKLFEGIGAELGYRDGLIIVVSPIEGSPAIVAGLRPGDVIIKVDEYSVLNSDNVYDIVAKIRGDAGTTVTLTIYRQGESDYLTIPIVRGEITVPSMTKKTPSSYQSDITQYDNKYAVINVSRFTESTLPEWENRWDVLVEEVRDGNYDGLILDLRNNPGGYFDAAIYAGNDFLPIGTVVSKQQDRDGGTQEYKVTRMGRLLDIPVVVLVNEGSASASEILAGALQQNGRAKIIGMPTYGKGTAQNVLPLDDGSSLHITVMKWLLPDGTWLNNESPITPDIEQDKTDEDFTKGVDPQIVKALETLDQAQ